MINQVSPLQLSDWLQSVKEHGKPVVLDVREPIELQHASVKPDNFELITIPMSIVPVRLAELDRTRPIACLCHHGARSMQVAYFLKQQGFTTVANISGGIHAWSNELDPSVAQY